MRRQAGQRMPTHRHLLRLIKEAGIRSAPKHA
jgi:hypothetical protein